MSTRWTKLYRPTLREKWKRFMAWMWTTATVLQTMALIHLFTEGHGISRDGVVILILAVNCAIYAWEVL